MNHTLPLETQHEQFVQWAIDQGVTIHENVKPAQIANRGVGLICTGPVNEDEALTNVPVSALITESNVPKWIKDKIGPITVHGLFAAILTVESDSIPEWRSVWPSWEDFASVPLVQTEELNALLPFRASDLLSNQERKFAADFAAVSAAFPEVKEKEYLYFWLIVNTRSFYFYMPGKKRKKRARDDCMALCPFNDYFNHAEQGVLFSGDGFAISADRSYEKGDELFISYGDHSNDFLLAEYGFIMEENKFDEVRLDEYILLRLSQSQRDLLDDHNMLGNYILHGDGVCYRTESTIRLLVLPHPQEGEFMDEDETPAVEKARREKMGEVLEEVMVDAKGKQWTLRERGKGESLLCVRWRQIHDMARKAKDEYR